MQELIHKYWEGNTSLEEEQKLRNWVKTAPSTPENRRLAAVMSWYDQEREKKMETSVVAPLSKSQTHTKYIWIKWAAGIAASFLLLLSIWINASQKEIMISQKDIVFVDTYENPDQALEEAEKALLLISAKLNATQKYQGNLNKIKILTDMVESQQNNYD